MLWYHFDFGTSVVTTLYKKGFPKQITSHSFEFQVVYVALCLRKLKLKSEELTSEELDKNLKTTEEPLNTIDEPAEKKVTSTVKKKKESRLEKKLVEHKRKLREAKAKRQKGSDIDSKVKNKKNG